MATLPTYMTLDDHEVQNDWPKTDVSNPDVLSAALHSYVLYQLSHSPLIKDLSPIGAQVEAILAQGMSDGFWHYFSDGCCDFFVADTRTKRTYKSNGDEIEGADMLGPIQLEALTQWLNDGSGKVKFIISSVPFFPDRPLEERQGEEWSTFQKERTDILDYIAGERD